MGVWLVHDLYRGWMNVLIIIHGEVVFVGLCGILGDLDAALANDVQVFSSEQNLVLPAVECGWYARAARHPACHWSRWRYTSMLTLRSRDC